MSTPIRRKIVIVESEQPQIVGRWTVAEVQQMAQALAQWAGSLTVPETETG